MKNFGKWLGGAMLTLIFVFGITAATSSTAQAQWRDRDGQYRRDRDNDRYRDRNRDGRRDRDWNRNRRTDRYEDYGRNGGYNNRDGYGRNGAYGNNSSYRYEQQQGYQQGLNTGASDAQRGQSFSPQRSRYYKNASSHAYRDGFVQGYNSGYRQYSGYGNDGYRRRNTGNGIGGVLGTIFGRP